MSYNYKTVDKNQCLAQMLDYKQINSHQQLVVRSISDKNWTPTLKIEDTCRIENGGVIRLKSSKIENLFARELNLNITAFVPAAGASSRYLSPLADLCNAFESRSLDQIQNELSKIKNDSRSKTWILPREVEELLAEKTNLKSLSVESLKRINKVLKYPKALFPCNTQYQNFVQIKNMEHSRYEFIKNEVYITPPGLLDDFSNSLNSRSQINTSFFEQDLSMSTIRFHANGDPVLDQQGQYSIVPAGHGALINLFPKIKSQLPETDCLFIRNSDNLSGMNLASVRSTQEFFYFYNFIFENIRLIRQSLRQHDVTKASQIVEGVLNFFEIKYTQNDAHGLLWLLLEQVFHTSSSEKSLENLCKLYDRPLNVLGMVPNSGTDVGGTPVFHYFLGKKIKVCLEVPHASESDKQVFLNDPLKATHFNPVFAMAELPDNIECYTQLENSPFWLLVKKQWQSTEVRYYETVLYEILGNSIMSNLIFVEIPRHLFNPNKSLDDCFQNMELTFPS